VLSQQCFRTIVLEQSGFQIEFDGQFPRRHELPNQPPVWSSVVFLILPARKIIKRPRLRQDVAENFRIAERAICGVEATETHAPHNGPLGFGTETIMLARPGNQFFGQEVSEWWITL